MVSVKNHTDDLVFIQQRYGFLYDRLQRFTFFHHDKNLSHQVSQDNRLAG